VRWAKPLSGGSLDALFVCPYNNSHEVVELAQRLDVNYTVIMNAGHSAWADGYSEGDTATPLKGVEAKTVLDKLARRRLSLAHHYDVIVIAKVSWQVIPPHIRDLILAHVERGAELVYVSPNRLQPGWNRIDPPDDEDATFNRLFESNADAAVRKQIVGALPLDVMPLHLLNRALDFKPLPRPRHQWQQTALSLSTAAHGKGRVQGIDYFDETISTRTHSSLSPSYQHPLGDHDEVIYDLSHALLTRGILWATNRLQPMPIVISVDAPDTELAAPVDSEIAVLRWSESTPTTVSVDGALTQAQRVMISVNDMWGRQVHVADAERLKDETFEFRIPVNDPLSELWDVHACIVDEQGVVDRRTTPVPILNNTFDDFLFMLIFAPTPGTSNWKGALHARQLRKYGINAAYTYLIYSRHDEFFHNAREHLRSVVYAEHSGELLSPADHNADFTVENTTHDLAEISRMLRRIADTGEKLDPKEFPYRMGAFSADWFNGRMDNYKLAGRFGSPFYTLTGENYLLGEFKGVENSGFAPTTTKVFQKWCRAEYADDLDALNVEWGSDLKSWNDVRGIMLNAAVEQDQLPRWVDFRYFMRSRVWNQFFIDWTDMLRRAIPDARTGRVGHDHHDFSRYRRQMTSSKLYVGQEKFAEWRHALTAELPQSFGNDEGFLMAPQSMIRWTHDLESSTNRKRWPWMVLMLGLDGFDWERGLGSPTLGGGHCFTPDYSEPLPYFRDISDEVLTIQRGIGKLTMPAKPNRSKVAMLWSPRNHYISRCLPSEENGFSGTWMSNVSVIGGAVSDALSLMNSIRIRPTIVAPEDVIAGDLEKRGFKALILPYNKGMSPEEATAIRRFVAAGGLVIADNDPATYSQHGRKLEQPALADLFPVTDKIHTQSHGKGHAAYLPNVINGHTTRLENDDHHGADTIEKLLASYANERPTIQLLDQVGQPRRDTLMRVFRHGQTMLVGLLRAQTAAADQPARTTMKLPEVRHVWDVRNRNYLGKTDTLKLNLDQQPRFLALLPDYPASVSLSSIETASPGGKLTLNGVIESPMSSKELNIGHAVHIEVFGPDGEELEWFRQNVVFSVSTFRVVLPVSLSAKQGRYRVVVEHAITGTRSETTFDVITPRVEAVPTKDEK